MLLALYREDKDQQLFYYYMHDYQGSLFTKYSFTAQWGREFDRGRKKDYYFASRREKDRKLRQILRRRALQGYRLFYSYPSMNSYKILFDDIKVKKTV
jgi:hypothetical protein